MRERDGDSFERKRETEREREGGEEETCFVIFAFLVMGTASVPLRRIIGVKAILFSARSHHSGSG